MATYTFRPVPAWGAVGQFARVGLAKSKAFPATLPAGGSATVVQGGVTKAGYVESDATGLVPQFTTTDIPSVMVDFGFGPIIVHSLEAITAGAASAAAAAVSATSAATSAAAAGSAAAAAVAGKASQSQVDGIAADLDATKVAAFGTGRAWTLTSLPEYVNCERGYNSASWTQDNVCSTTSYRYVVYWAADKTPHIAQLNRATGAWSTFDLSTIAGNPLASPVAGTDGHNTLSVGVDSTGRIHVAGNQHNHALRYARSTNANDITVWSAPGMVGTNETSMSYPTFVTLPTGEMLFAYRDGSSGDGDMILNRYSTGSSTWSRLGTVIDGTPSSESPYWNRLAVDNNGDLHLFFCFRGTGSGDTNNDFCYTRLINLASGSLAARKADGSTQTLPITHANAEVVIDTAASGSGLMNQQGADVDTNGRPHAAQWLHDGSGYTQLRHVWHDGTAWHNDTASNLTRHVDLVSASDPGNLARAQVACGPGGTTYMVYRASYGGRVGKVLAVDCTGGPIKSEFSIADIELGQWEPSVDSRALREGRLVMLLSTPIGDYTAFNLDAAAVSPGWAGVLEVDIKMLPRIRAGLNRTPAMQQVSYAGLPGTTTTITATSASAVTGVPTLTVPANPGSLYFCRCTCRFNGTTSDTVVNIRPREFQSTAASRNLALIAATGTGTVHTATPWMPLTNAGVEGQWSWVQLLAHKSGTGNGQLFLGSLEVAELQTWG